MTRKPGKMRGAARKPHGRSIFEKMYALIAKSWLLGRLKKNWGKLLSGLIVAILVPYGIYRLTVAEPEIYSTTTVPNTPTLQMIPGEGPLVSLAVTVKDRFKNFSFLRDGFIDKVETTPISFEAIPKVEVIFIDKQALSPRMEKEIEMRFIVTVDPRKSAELLKQTGKTTSFSVRAFDNHGRLIPSVTGGPYFTDVLVMVSDKPF